MATQVEQIKEKLGIVDVVSQYIKLEKAGSNLKAKCPFHNEKTPSFFVSPARNSYYCFGCNAKGDIFSFVEQFEGVDFMGALKVLGEKAGVQIVYERQDVRDKKSRLYSIMEKATLFFEDNLKSQKKVLEYLKKRGLDDKTIKQWRVGYSPDSWSSLYEYLKGKYNTDELERAGLIKKSEKGGDYYDRFRGRIMFPIFDNSGRTVAFSGRIFEGGEDEAKYINSPETELFSKSKILYGFDKAKFSIRKLNFSIIVEGQMDLLLSYKAGFTNTVAVSGTALTGEQIGLLKRLSNNVVMAFDSDSAGIASARKGVMLALSNGMDVKVAHLKEGEDPADVLKESSEEWKKIIKGSKHIVDFLLDILRDTIDDKRKLHLKTSQTVIPYIAKIPNKIDQAHFVSVVAERLGVPEDAVWEEVNKVLPAQAGPEDDTFSEVTGAVEESPQPQSTRRSSIENKLKGIILWQKSLSKPLVDVDALYIDLEKTVGKEKAKSLIDDKGEQFEGLLFEAELLNDNPDKIKEDFDELICHLKKEYIKDDLVKVFGELKSAEAENNSKKTAETLKKYKELSDELANINIK
ncbi:MAG: DNA primase [Candidatus Paceibacteria bacterium]